MCDMIEDMDEHEHCFKDTVVYVFTFVSFYIIYNYL